MVTSPNIPEVMVDDAFDDTVNLSFSSIVFMTLRNVRSRMGRSMITLLGVVLGSAFLMAVGTSSLLSNSLSDKESDRMAAADSAAKLAAKLGTLEGRTLAIVVEHWDDYTRNFLNHLDRQGEVQLRIYRGGVAVPGFESHTADSLGEAMDGANALVICNHGIHARDRSSLPPQMQQLQDKIVMDLQGLYVDDQRLADEGVDYVDPHEVDASTLNELQTQVNDRARAFWLIGVSLLVSGIGIANALLMSVTERFREIGTLKCLGAMDRLVVQMFLIESGILGLVGSSIGVSIGLTIALAGQSWTFGWMTVWSLVPWSKLLKFATVSLFVGLVVAMVAAIYPAIVAARMTAADAMRSEV